MLDYKGLRDRMVEEQLKPMGIYDPAVLSAMREVPRHEFVPAEMKRMAYEDGPLPIGEGQTISQPFMVAYMIEALWLSSEARVLEIGTGSGYAAAVLSLVVKEVHTVERLPVLADRARERLKQLGYDNVHVHVGDGSLGLPEQAPYDGIIVTAGAPSVPELLKKQLEVGGGLVIPVGTNPELQILVLVRRLRDEEYQSERLMAVRFVPLIGAGGWRVG
ncbi:MAG TPA: protein-L-isoaspartate(D-aspartate) O-methyltransferase [Desulfuromonadaceae bacterium]|jgi:protein-L-isoaspartate(D-aspartate) O-methyltransferase